MRTEEERVVKIVEDFQNKINASKKVEEYLRVPQDDPQVSVGGLLGLGTVRWNSVIIFPMYGEELKDKKKELRLK